MTEHFLLEFDRVHGGTRRGRKVAETQVQDGSIQYEAKLDERSYSSERGRRCHSTCNELNYMRR